MLFSITRTRYTEHARPSSSGGLESSTISGPDKRVYFIYNAALFAFRCICSALEGGEIFNNLRRVRQMYK